ncbi:hypothetical protein LCGC14_1324080 [marine sediment metagenome]|uniref:Uncharacterized protein n=1 Tax=marine sediment metagenome TaxID=412755 RepID=A0A0F9KIN7_9ZZZZ
MLTREELLKWMGENVACLEAYRWIGSHDLTPEEMWREDKASFMCWVVKRLFPRLSIVLCKEAEVHGLELFVAESSYVGGTGSFYIWKKESGHSLMSPSKVAGFLRICIPYHEVAEAIKRELAV